MMAMLFRQSSMLDSKSPWTEKASIEQSRESRLEMTNAGGAKSLSSFSLQRLLGLGTTPSRQLQRGPNPGLLASDLQTLSSMCTVAFVLSIVLAGNHQDSLAQ